MDELPISGTQPLKKPKGFQPGISGNPAGRPATGFQSFKDRLCYWLETKSIDDIEKLVLKKSEWRKLPAIDGIVVRRIHAALQHEGSGADFALVLDRLLGKPAQAITGEDGKPLMPAMDIMELARRGAFLLSLVNIDKAKSPVILEHAPNDKK